jgi:hypothetical protein
VEAVVENRALERLKQNAKKQKVTSITLCIWDKR